MIRELLNAQMIAVKPSLMADFVRANVEKNINLTMANSTRTNPRTLKNLIERNEMFNYKKLHDKYQTDAAFNKSVNVFRQMIEDFGFTPHEIREGLFLAQYLYERDHVYKFVRTHQDLEQAASSLQSVKTPGSGFRTKPSRTWKSNMLQMKT